MGWIIGAAVVVVGFLALRKGKLLGPDAATGPTAYDCKATAPDWRYTICLVRIVGAWTWRAWLDKAEAASPGIPDELDGGELAVNTQAEAHVAAWVALYQAAPRPEGDDVAVIEAEREAHGLRLTTDGTIAVVNQAAYINYASQLIAAQQAAGDDGAGVVLTLMVKLFGWSWNPFRATIAGATFREAIERFEATPQNPPQQARAIMGIG